MRYNHDSQCLQLSFISCQVARFAEELTSNVLITSTVSRWLEQYWVITAWMACSIVYSIALTNVVFCPHTARLTGAVLCVPSHWLKWYFADCQNDWSRIVCTIALTKVVFCPLTGWVKLHTDEALGVWNHPWTGPPEVLQQPPADSSWSGRLAVLTVEPLCSSLASSLSL